MPLKSLPVGAFPIDISLILTMYLKSVLQMGSSDAAFSQWQDPGRTNARRAAVR